MASTESTPVDAAMKSLSVAESSATTVEEAKLAQRRLAKANKAAAKAAAGAVAGDKASRAAAHVDGDGGKKNKRTGRRDESPTVQLSKALAYMLRHGTEKEGLKVRADGYVPLDAVLARPKVAKLVMTASGQAPTLQDVRAVVEGNDKKRFELMQDGDTWLVRAVQGHSIAQVTELDHVTLTLDTLHLLAHDDDDDNNTPSRTLPGGIEIMHGTTRDAWSKIQQSGGLHRMQRNHIHLAKGRPSTSSTVVSGMRASSAVILHIDIVAALRDGIPFFLASNGAVLTSGKDDSGQLPLRYIVRAEDSKSGATLWEQCKEG